MKKADRPLVKDVGLFFLLGFVDERAGVLAAARVVARLKAQFGLTADSLKDAVPATELIRECRLSWKAARKSSPRNQAVAGDCLWMQVRSGFDISAWLRYQKDAPDDDLMVLLFSYVFSFSDAELADGFQTSVGTIRYRLGKAVRQLGLIVRGAP